MVVVVGVVVVFGVGVGGDERGNKLVRKIK